MGGKSHDPQNRRHVGLFNRCKRELQRVLGNICITEEGRILVINHPAVNIALEAVAKLYDQEKEADND